MLILPMNIKGVTTNLVVSFKNVYHEKNHLLANSKNLFLGEFQVNKETYFGEDVDLNQRSKMENYLKLHPELLTDFIRKNLQTKEDPIWVFSQNYREKDFCTRYRIPHPPKRGNLALDKIYGKLVNDLRLNIEEKAYDSFLSFEDIGFNTLFENDQETAVREGVEVLDYLQQLNFKMIDEWNDTRVPQALSMRPKKFLTIYKEMAQKNTKIYMRISKLHEEIYAVHPSWLKLTEQQKVYIKTKAAQASSKKVA